MSCSLTYDDVLSRVRIEADGLCATGAPAVVDTFTRSVTGGWSSADSGQAYTIDGGLSSHYSVNGTRGLHNNVNENEFHNSIMNVGVPDFDYAITVQTNKLAAGSNQCVELAARVTDVQNFYAARLNFFPDQHVTIDVRKRVADVQTTFESLEIGAAGAHQANQDWRVRVSVRGSSIRAKAWLLSTFEPPDWQVEGTDTDLVTGNNISVRSLLFSGTTNEPTVFSFDNLASFGSTTATVDRTLNGINYTTVRGATEVPVTTGCELARIVDDYEFPAGEEITYRVRSFNADGSLATTTTCQITVDLDGVWIKSIGRPFLNQRVNCLLNPSPITRRARNGIFDVVGRTFPIAVTDVRGGQNVTVRVVTETTEQRKALDLLLISGDPVFYHTPADYALPTMYAVIEDTSVQRPLLGRPCGKDYRLFELPSVEVAAPSADVVGSTSTWQTVVNTYATWADVLMAHPTWADLLELVGDGSEVIVP